MQCNDCVKANRTHLAPLIRLVRTLLQTLHTVTDKRASVERCDQHAEGVWPKIPTALKGLLDGPSLPELVPVSKLNFINV